MLDILGKSKWLLAAALFAFCVAPTFISYQPYLFIQDDSDYLQRSIAVSRAFWSGNVHGLGAAMVSIRPPAMTLLGLPWGPLTSWDAAGKCFITLAAVISLLAASCLYLLLRIGAKPFFLMVASACVVASIGPYPRGAAVHAAATAFMADSLLAWTSLAAVLLIPYEARTHCTSVRSAVVRGILWGSILSLGAMTKMSFLYFVFLIAPILFCHKASSRRTAEYSCGADRICLLVSTVRCLFGSMGGTSLRHCEGIILRTARELILSSAVAVSRQYYPRIAGLGALVGADGYRAHIPRDQKANKPVGAGFPGASDHDWFRHRCARVY